MQEKLKGIWSERKGAVVDVFDVDKGTYFCIYLLIKFS